VHDPDLGGERSPPLRPAPPRVSGSEVGLAAQVDALLVTWELGLRGSEREGLADGLCEAGGNTWERISQPPTVPVKTWRELRLLTGRA
jgi:hypothetical protein